MGREGCWSWAGVGRQGWLQGAEGSRVRVTSPSWHPRLLQVSEAPAGQRRLHSLSVSSDTTADSFSSLNPEEVSSWGCEDQGLGQMVHTQRPTSGRHHLPPDIGKQTYLMSWWALGGLNSDL